MLELDPVKAGARGHQQVPGRRGQPSKACPPPEPAGESPDFVPGVDGSGLAACDGTVAEGSPIDTTAVGDQSFTVETADNAGNTDSATNGYSVIYEFAGAGGFQAPIDNPTTVNTAKAGSTIPVKWQLPDGQGGFLCDLSAVASLQAQKDLWGSSPPSDPVEEVATAGSSGLQCDDGQYQYNRKTAKTQKDKCYVFILTLDDGSEYDADFPLK